MPMPKLPTRPLIAAAVLAAAVILTTGIGQTHATEPVNPQVAENSHGGTPISTPMSATSTAGTMSYSLSGTEQTSRSTRPPARSALHKTSAQTLKRSTGTR